MRSGFHARKYTGSNCPVDGVQRYFILMFLIPSPGNDLRRPKQEKLLQYKSKCSSVLSQIVFAMAVLSPELVAVIRVPVVIAICLFAPVALYFTADRRGTAAQGSSDLAKTFPFF